VGGRHFVLGILAQKLHEAAERNQRNAVFGVAAAKAKQARSETQRKAQHFDAAQLGNAEVAELVNEHERSDEEDEVPRLRQIMHGGWRIAEIRWGGSRACPAACARRGRRATRGRASAVSAAPAAPAAAAPVAD